MINVENGTALNEIRDFKAGGMVISVKEGVSKNNNPYGFVKIEDFTGTGEISFWGDDWVKWRNYFKENMFLLLKGRIQQKQYRQENEIKVLDIKLLSEESDKLINKITIEVPINMINGALISDISNMIDNNPGNAELLFKIYDISKQNLNITMKSSSKKISVNKQLIDFLSIDKGLQYKIN